MLEVFCRAERVPAKGRIDVGALLHGMRNDSAEQDAAATFSGTAALVTSDDPVALRRIVGNLLANAALRHDGRADVGMRQSDSEVIIRIDDGPGIPEQQLAAVLQPFYRVEGSRNRHRGRADLGLFIAREWTERQGGRLTPSNRPGAGLRAEVVLPADRKSL